MAPVVRAWISWAASSRAPLRASRPSSGRAAWRSVRSSPRLAAQSIDAFWGIEAHDGHLRLFIRIVASSGALPTRLHMTSPFSKAALAVSQSPLRAASCPGRDPRNSHNT